MEPASDNTNDTYKLVLVFSISAFVLYILYLGGDSDGLGIFSLFWTIGALIFSIISLSKTKRGKGKGRGYIVFSIIATAVLLLFTTVFDILEVIEEEAAINAQKSSEQLTELEGLRSKLNELENRKPTIVTKSIIAEPSLASLVSEWTPRVGLIVCGWKNSKTVASGSFVLNRTDYGNLALTNRHVLLDEYGYPPNECILLVNGKEYSIPWDKDTYYYNREDYTDFGFVKTNIPSEIIKVCNELRFSKPEIGDKIVVLGYPGVGSTESITATEGIISGIESDYYVTSAKIEHGNSGGAAILIKNNCYLGIPSYVEVGSAETLGRILKADFVMLPR